MLRFRVSQDLCRFAVAALITVIGAGAVADDSDKAIEPAVADVATNRVESTAAGESTNLFSIITNSSNKYERCRITKVEPSAITVFHSKGIARIPFTDLSEEWRKKYTYDPDKARAYEKELAKKQQQKQQQQQQRNTEAGKAKQQPASSPKSIFETFSAKTAVKPKKTEQPDGAIERSRKAAKHALTPQDVAMPPVSF